MAIKDSIAKLRKALRTTQTNAPAVIDTLIRGLDGVEEAAEEERTYSTDERIVGTWIDGKELYEKTINFGALPNSDTKEVSHGIANIDQIIGIDAIAISNTNTTITIPYVSPGGEVSIYATRAIISITTASSRSNFNGYIIIIRNITLILSPSINYSKLICNFKYKSFDFF